MENDPVFLEKIRFCYQPGFLLLGPPRAWCRLVTLAKSAGGPRHSGFGPARTAHGPIRPGPVSTGPHPGPDSGGPGPGEASFKLHPSRGAANPSYGACRPFFPCEGSGKGSQWLIACSMGPGRPSLVTVADSAVTTKHWDLVVASCALKLYGGSESARLQGQSAVHCSVAQALKP